MCNCNYCSNKGILTDVYNEVKEFHSKFNHPVSDIPTQLTESRKADRAMWMREEVQEFIDSKTIHDDIDAMIDLMYFALGTCVEMGIDPSIPFELVQKANMSKLFPDGKPHYNEHNKVIKPEGWVAPDDKIKEYIEELVKANANQYTLFNESSE